MTFEEVSWFSNTLNRWMRVKIYGWYGAPIIVFPCEGKQSEDFSDNGMIDYLQDDINGGKYKLFCVDSNDDESICSSSWDKVKCAAALDRYHYYIINEVLPLVYEKQKGHCLPILAGCAGGATHAAISYFRRPDLFGGILGLSGMYDTFPYFGGIVDDNIYYNSPNLFLGGMTKTALPIVVLNSNRKALFVCGSGNYEDNFLSTNYQLSIILKKKHIKGNVIILDSTSVHDWSSWKWQFKHFINDVL